MSGYRPEMQVPGEGWKSNGLVFTTDEEAELWARDLFARWTVPTDSRVVACDEEPNYRRLADGRIEKLGGPADGAIVAREA